MPLAKFFSVVDYVQTQLKSVQGEPKKKINKKMETFYLKI